MKKYLLIVLAALGACQEENEVVYSVDPVLTTYVDTFYAEAAERGVNLPQNLVAELKDIQGISQADRHMDQNFVRVNATVFPGLNPQIQEAHVYYRMAQVFLHIDISEGESFANPDFMFTPYNPVNREAMLDNLFNGL